MAYIRHSLIPAVVVLVAGSLHAQSLLYFETFNHTGTGGPSTAAGWAGGYPGDNSDTTLREANWYETEPGKREIGTGVNNHQLASHTEPGAIVQSTDPAWVQFYTTEYSEGTDFSELGRIEFDVLNLERTRDYHLTVEAGGEWFISADTITTPNFDMVWHQEQGLDMGSVSWFAAPDGFAGVGKNPLTGLDGLTSAEPSGTVSGFGFLYHMFGTGNVVVDNYAVYSVPEPSAFAWVGGLLAIGLVVVRRRRQR